MKRKIFIVIFVVVMVSILCACGKTPIQTVTAENTTVNASATQKSDSETYENTETVTFPVEVVGSSEGDQDDIIEWVDKDLEGEYVKAVKNEDGSVDFILTPEQRQEWLVNLDRMILDKEKEITQVDGKYYAEHSDDYSHVSLYIDKSCSNFSVEFESLYLLMWCRLGQAIKGKQDISIAYDMINVDTGKTIDSANLRSDGDEVSVDDAKWAESYQITDEEADTIRQKAAACKEIVIDPVAMNSNAITIIGMLGETGGNDYEYLFIDANGNVILGITDEQQNTMLSNMKETIETTKSEFKALGNGYDVKINKDYSEISMYFNNELEEESQEHYTAYFAMTCALIQTLENEGTTPSVQVYIYNSDTGETVFTGNLADGIIY